ncbi:alpha/beta hydrolase [Actinomadura hibisca]|uniref:alpha/beta hydrolase n=1 Tax=Actinomadura hibisca TaxID=68565 RepID=UPI0008305F44|nr:alpha/beta hydrolase [Actinomadura hibisca]
MHRYAAVSAVLAVTASVTSAQAGSGPYAAPAALPELSSSALAARYNAVRHDIGRARATAERVGDTGRARALGAFLKPGRRFLSFDARGHGRVVEVLGDLGRADRIAVVVPGADGNLTNFDSWKWAGGGARALQEQARRTAPGTRLTVVAWLGYDSPSTLSPAVLGTGHADDAARDLRTLIAGFGRTSPGARIGLLCHSYGSVVCGRAKGLPVDEIALYGSPGTTAGSVADLRTTAKVWAGRARGDWMQYIPKVRMAGLGFGRDPLSPAFGARRFDAGAGPHSAYLKPGSTALRNLALIALGRDAEVRHG